MKKPRYDLTKKNCHACGSPLQRDMKSGTEKCAHHTCLIRDIPFSIPFMNEDIQRVGKG